MISCEPQSLSVRVTAGIARLDAPVHCPPAGDCRVWLVSLTSDATVIAALSRLLDDDERVRADAFKVGWARNQFVQVRGMLRLLLGQCLGQAAADIGFVYGRFGKPALAQPCDLYFNVAHSGDYALLGIAIGVELGVDIERLGDSRDLAALSARVFSPAEATQWLALPDDERAHAFFSVWTAKEAVAKAVGDGLQLPFPVLDVGLIPGPKAMPFPKTMHGRKAAGACMVAAGHSGHCRLMMLAVPLGYAGALAIRA